MLTVQPTGGALGAVVTGIDLSQPQPATTTAEIRRAWLDHLVLVFPDQPLTPDDYEAFARTIGTPMQYPFVDSIEENPFIIEVRKEPHETENFGGAWHSDTVYLERPPMASMLLARDVPPTGGDTEFANMYMAWDTLDDERRTMLDGRRAMHSSALADALRDHRVDDAHRTVFESTHPAVRTHPETGRKALYVNGAHTHALEGVDPELGRSVLDAVFAHQVQPAHVWRLQWQPNTLALWDNRCTLHHPRNDYQGHRRVMHRITLEGDVPR